MIDIHPAILAECIYPARRAEIPAHLFPVSLGLERPPEKDERAPMPLLVRLALGAAILACVWLAGCQSWPPPPCPPYCAQTPMATRTPTSPAPKVTPVRSPTPEPAPAPSQGTTGSAELLIPGLDTLPLSRTRDNLILTTLTWETSGLDRSVPVLELAVRGTTAQPCLMRTAQRGCGQLAGLVARYSSNLGYDSTLDWSEEHEAESQTKACGAGTNYHARLALGAYGPAGSVRVEVAWTPDQITVRTPVDSWTYRPRVAGSVGLGRVIVGAPWPRRDARGWLWQDFQAGVPVVVTGWQASGGSWLQARCSGE